MEHLKMEKGSLAEENVTLKREIQTLNETKVLTSNCHIVMRLA